MVLDKATLDRLYRGITENFSWLNKYYAAANTGNMQERNNASLLLGRTIGQLGALINQFHQSGLQVSQAGPQVLPGPTARANKINDLIAFADFLDANKYYALANKVDSVIELCADTRNVDLVKLADCLDTEEFFSLADKVDDVGELLCVAEDYGYAPKVRRGKEDAEKPQIQPMNKGALSTRYCPDHRGVQAIRIEENLYQCPLDGKKYNYEAGYINYEGQKVPGGSVASQTPETSDFGGIPMRFYDTRSEVLNRIN